jgi:hypothetical protein
LGPLALLTLTLACATLQSGPPTVSLRVASNVPDATVWIDDHLVAPVSDFAKTDMRLIVGFHRIEIRALGYYSRFEEVDAKPGLPVTIHAPLHQLLD